MGKANNVTMKCIYVNEVKVNVSSRKSILNNITFNIQYGDRIAILGKNGSGKTTLLDTLVGATKPTSGFVKYDDQKEYNKMDVGVVWDNMNILPLFKVKEVLKYFSMMYKVDFASTPLYDILNLYCIKEKYMKILSKGERKKVLIMIALMHNPSFLFLDEALSDLDKQTQNMLWKDVLISNGRTVVFSTHDWKEAERNATKIMFMHNGNMLCKPENTQKILIDFPFKRKIVIDSNIKFNSHNFNYVDGNNRIYLVDECNSDFIKEIQNKTNNYSVIPLNIYDVYNFYLLK